MPTGILKWKLPEEQEEFENALKASKYLSALWDVSQVLRDTAKYGDLTEDQHKTVDAIRTKFFEILEEHDVSLD